MSEPVATRPRLQRVVVKLSGEGFSGPKGSIDPDIAGGIVDDLVAVVNQDIQIAVVVGGGNFVRGASMTGMNRAVADQMGMLATAMNGLALQDMLDARGIETRVMSAVPMASFSESFIRRRAIRHLEKKARHHPRCRDRQSILYDGQCGSSAGQRARRGGPAEGDSSGRRVLRRPEERSERHAL